MGIAFHVYLSHFSQICVKLSSLLFFLSWYYLFLFWVCPSYTQNSLLLGCDDIGDRAMLFNESSTEVLADPENDRGVMPHSIDQSNQSRSRALRSIQHERVHNFHSKQFSCRQAFN